MERIIADALEEAEIAYIRGKATGELDFYIVGSGVWIECKRFYSPRIANQMARQSNVIAVQGMAAARQLATWIKQRTTHHD